MRRFATIVALALSFAVAPAAAQTEALSLPSDAAGAPAEEAATPIPLQSPDRDIRLRLLQLFREIEGLEQVNVQVRGGVVTLTGMTLDVTARAEAEEVAGRLDGVVSVQNELEVERRVDRRLEPLFDKARALGSAILSFLPLMVVALLALAGFWLVGVLFTRKTALFRRIAPNPFIEALFEQVVRLVFIIVGLVVAMSILGATALIETVLGAAGVLGLAVGFAVRDTIENYIASILLSIRQPFRPNDAVLIDGIEGRVTTLNSRATIITTWDGNEVRIPNAIVYKAKITNFTHTPERRFEFEVRVTFDTPLSCALAIALKAAKSVDGVLHDPGPTVLIDRVGEFGIVLKVLGWANQSSSDYGKVRSETIRAVKEALEAENIDLAEPVQNVRQLAADEDDQPVRTSTPRRPTEQELREIKDTSVDTTIKDKVKERREEVTNDLLTTAAPRETT